MVFADAPRDQPDGAPLSAPEESAGRDVAESTGRANTHNRPKNPRGPDHDTRPDDDWPNYDYWPRDHNRSGNHRWLDHHDRAAAFDELAAGRIAADRRVGER